MPRFESMFDNFHSALEWNGPVCIPHKKIRKFRIGSAVLNNLLLFIAVTALLTVDAPAWLYFTGYWLIQACNAIGLAYHATLCADLFRDYEKRITAQGVPIETTSVVEWMRALLVNGSWYATCSLLLTKQTH